MIYINQVPDQIKANTTLNRTICDHTLNANRIELMLLLNASAVHCKEYVHSSSSVVSRDGGGGGPMSMSVT